MFYRCTRSLSSPAVPVDAVIEGQPSTVHGFMNCTYMGQRFVVCQEVFKECFVLKRGD